MDFLMCFLTVMIDCHKQGRMREWILNYVTEETDFGELDWCGYVVEKLRDCKDGWRRCDRGSPFVGPLTILTLLYVDYTECEGMGVDHRTNPITFWNMERLKVRENLEIKNGGFGTGTMKGLSSCTDNRTRKDRSLLSVAHLLEKRLEVEKLLDIITMNKKKTENALGKLYQEYPENEEVLSLISRYESILDEKPRWPTKPTKEITIADGGMKLHETTEREYYAATESGEKPTDEVAVPGGNETTTIANFILELSQFRKEVVEERKEGRWKD